MSASEADSIFCSSILPADLSMSSQRKTPLPENVPSKRLPEINFNSASWPARLELSARLPTGLRRSASVELRFRGPLAVLFLISSSTLVLPERARERLDGRSTGQF